MTDVKQAAQGHWRQVLLELGLDPKHLGINKPCPICPQSHDRFSFTDKGGLGTWFCRGCGGGSGFDLLMALYGWTFAEAAKRVKDVLGVAAEHKPKADKRDPLKQMRAILRSSAPASENGHVARYLRGRGLSALPPGLFEHPGLVVGAHPYPAMIGPVQAVSRALVSLHETFIEGDGKAPVAVQKYIMSPAETVSGGAIRLWAPAETLGLAEGIETAIAAHELFRVPVWSCLNAYGLEAVQLPETVRNVLIFADNDETTEFAGQKAAFIAAARFAKEGRRVHVKVPPIPGHDWLSELLLRRGRVAA